MGAVTDRTQDVDPAAFVRLLGHPVRWQLLRELAWSDRAVKELTALVGEPQNLVSYHLRQLRDAGVVRARHSSADGRDSYYAVDLDRCDAQLRQVGATLHPSLGRSPTPWAPMPRPVGQRRPRALFACTGNSARSQMAEALLRERSHGTIDAASAGSHPKALHPEAVRAMRRRGIDISAGRPTHLDELRHDHFDVVVTLCDRVREVCPELPGPPLAAHWSMPDPAADTTSPTELRTAFERTAVELESRIAHLLHLLTDPTTRSATHAHR